MRSFVLIPTLAVFLSGCLATSSQTEAPAAQPMVQPANYVNANAATSNKDKKLLENDNSLNEYVNDSLPSQIGYSLEELNKTEDEGEYPAIQDIASSDSDLMTPQERKKIEDELLRLAGQSQ